MFKNYIGWHIELTQRCPLACPACPRTVFYKDIVNPRLDIDSQALFNFFTKEHVNNLQYMQFQGNLGDPIYHPEFHNISEYFFPVKNLNVTTNGMQKLNFWERVLETWPETSTITLSIDGLKDTNSIYRVNSKWNQIQDLFNLISTKKRQCKIEWKYIVFEHNHHQVDEAERMAKSIGINTFRIQKTRELDPTISVKEYNNPKWFKYNNVEYVDQISPFCFTGDMHYIDAYGNYYPCCWWAGTGKKSDKFSTININNNTLESVKEHFLSISSVISTYNTAPDVCKIFCRKIKNNTNEMKIVNTQLNRKIKNLNG